ncbi:hypothetical protein Tco_0414005 [Tanacetum coccineum]
MFGATSCETVTETGAEVLYYNSKAEVCYHLALCTDTLEITEVKGNSMLWQRTLYKLSRILRYLKGTPSIGLWYPKCLGFDLNGYSYLDYVGCNMDRKSSPGACQLLREKLVCWIAKKQQSVVISSAEAEYVAAVGC